MSIIYVTTQGATIQRRSGQLFVCKDRSILQNLPENHVKQLILVGNIHLTTPVMSYCLENRIDVVFLSQGGKFRGRLSGGSSRAVEIRKRQYDRASDTSFCLELATSFVAGKIANQIAFARRQNARHSYPREMALLASMLKRCKSAAATENLLGIEGAASAAYFKMFDSWMPAPFRFEKRSANPPGNEANALLSLSYTLLYNRITTHLDLMGLDPYLGFFHQPKNGHAALASDLVEEFRPAVADPVVLRLMRRKQLKPTDFEKTARGFQLTPTGKRTFFLEFESKLASRQQAPDAGNAKLSISMIIERQARQLARVIRGEQEHYRPFTLK